MWALVKTSSEDRDFVGLVKRLDAELAGIDGDEHSYYAQFNGIAAIKHVIVAYEEDSGVAVACGGLKEYEPNVMEVKRMYTLPEYRGKGIGSVVLDALEKWAVELSCEKCVLETGKRQPDAVRLYQKNGYQIVPNYAQYIGVENSLCFAKQLK